MESTTHTLAKKKWLIISILFVILLILTLLISTSSKNKAAPVSQVQLPTPTRPVAQPSQLPQNGQSIELQKAIAEQAKVDEEYTTWKDTAHADYPWINKLPFATDKYYVYFDLDKKIFSATVYPGTGESVEDIKRMMLKDMKEIKKVPVENFTFEWTVYRTLQ